MVFKQIIRIYMGIRISKKTNNPATLRLLSKLTSFNFEQQFGEMERWDKDTRDLLMKLIDRLSKLV